MPWVSRSSANRSRLWFEWPIVKIWVTSSAYLATDERDGGPGQSSAADGPSARDRSGPSPAARCHRRLMPASRTNAYTEIERTPIREQT
jgi:hypothetical protein